MPLRGVVATTIIIAQNGVADKKVVGDWVCAGNACPIAAGRVVVNGGIGHDNIPRIAIGNPALIATPSLIAGDGHIAHSGRGTRIWAKVVHPPTRASRGHVLDDGAVAEVGPAP